MAEEEEKRDKLRLKMKIVCELFENLFIGLLAGLISGFIVYGFLEYREKKKWQLVKKQLVKFLNETINGILTSIRIAMGIEPPMAITNDNDFTIFIEEEILNKFNERKVKIEYLELEKRNNLLSNFRNMQDSLRQLGVLFVNFRTAHPWYVEIIFELQKKIYKAAMPCIIFPELGMSKYRRDQKFLDWRKLFSKNIYELCKFAIDIKNNRLIKDLIDENEK